MVFGSALSLAGILSFSTTFTSSAGLRLGVGPSIGVYVAILASLLAAVPFFRRDEQDRWVRGPRVAPDPTGYTQFLNSVNARQGSNGLPTPALASFPAEVPSGPSSPLAVPAAAPSRRFCPACGRWYLGEESFCPWDSTPLRAVAADVGW